jgi:Spy/CpxP family protein refolding chaperone
MFLHPQHHGAFTDGSYLLSNAAGATDGAGDEEGRVAHMFGFLIGTLSLFGLIKVARGGGRWGRGGGWGRGRSGGRRTWMLRRLFQHLDTTSGQEKVIDFVADDVERAGRALADEGHRARTEYARAMQGATFDTETVHASFERQKLALDDLQKALLAGMQKVHEVLEPDQRRAVGELIEYGPRAAAWGGRHGRHGRDRYDRRDNRDAGGPQGAPVNV